jgi:uroporphyrin-III C-methyltransferase
MSQDDLSNDRTAPLGVPSDPARVRPPAGAPLRRSGSGTLALALLLALLAIVGVGYVAWRQWHQINAERVVGRTASELQTRVDTLERTLTSVNGQSTALRQQFNDADQVNRSLRDELLSQDQRMRDLEAAVGKLSEKTLSGQDAMRLDETESLLRMADERYALFHDAQGAAQAYAMAEQSLAAVDDNAFSGVQQTIDAERQALLKSQPTDREQLLTSISQLRDQLAELPLKPLDTPVTAVDTGFWARVGRALSGVISVRRDNGAPLAVADSRLTRELVAMDLAQAQAAALASDDDASIDALKRADAGIAAQFDAQASSVQQARQRIATLSAQIKPAVPVKLGGALSELRNLRAVHALKSTVDTNAPVAVRSKP